MFAIAWPLYELLFGFPRFKRALMGGGPGVRIRAYARATATQWTTPPHRGPMPARWSGLPGSKSWHRRTIARWVATCSKPATS